MENSIPMTNASTSNDAGYQVIRRSGAITPFDPTKISVALAKAFLSVEGSAASGSRRVHQAVEQLTAQVVDALTRRAHEGRAFNIEDIQDQVELALMRNEHHKVARAYVLYREQQNQDRDPKSNEPNARTTRNLRVRADNGDLIPLDEIRLSNLVTKACEGLNSVSREPVLQEARLSLYDGISHDEVAVVLTLAARTLIETEPDYAYVAARLLLNRLRQEALSFVYGKPEQATPEEITQCYSKYFPRFIKSGIRAKLLHPELAEFDLKRLAETLDANRDMQFQFLGLQTLYDRYFLTCEGKRFELPQAFFMRVSMGLALNETDREARAIEFYEQLSTFNFMTSTPTLFNSGTLRPQLSSCFLSTVSDNLSGIFKSVKDNALLAKYSGGLGNDWTQVRGLGARINGTNGESQGLVPFLKVANDTAVAVNQGGKRKGAVCAYVESWHIDIEEFLELRKNTGDDRRRTHDMSTANWIPDLFMERVESNDEWTLFSPDETPDLHDLYGSAFKTAYEEYEQRASEGDIRVFRRIRAKDLWRKMLTMLFETGHPWITFKDPCNIRSPQRHTGVVHSSNLCTEITLNTSAEEVAVCNLGSINLVNHLTKGGLDLRKLEKTVTTAMRMLDNVIDVNFYTIPEAENANLQHRPVGLGMMGFQDALHRLHIPYASEAAVTFADRCAEAISYFAISASARLAAEHGPYPSYDGSLWSQGVLPLDSIKLMDEARPEGIQMDTSSSLDWDLLRATVIKNGMRNSNTMAIAPTATISNICGVMQSVEPAYQNLFVKSNMSGDFTVVNAALVNDLKALGLWDEVMIADLKYFDGSIGQIDRIPDELKSLYATAFEIDSEWLVKAASRRQKWLDQSQSLNLYLASASGKKLDELYRFAWHMGLKTTYYLRTRSATHVEKSTLLATDGKLNAVSAANHIVPEHAAPQPDHDGNLSCAIDDPGCEACQ